MLNTALPVLYKDGTIADNTYQIIAEDGVIPSWFKMFSAFSLRFVSILAYTAFVSVIVLASSLTLFYKIVASIRKQMKAKV